MTGQPRQSVVTGGGDLPDGFRFVYLDPTGDAAPVGLAAVLSDGPDHHAAALDTGAETSLSLWSEHVTGDGRADVLLLLSDPTGALSGPGGFTVLHALVEDAARALAVDPADVAVCRVAATSTVRPLHVPGWSVAALTSVTGTDEVTTVLLTDAVVDPSDLRAVLAGVLAAARTDRAVKDGAWVLLASGASGVRPATGELATGLGSVLAAAAGVPL